MAFNIAFFGTQPYDESSFKHKNAADISWAADIKSARTTAKILSGEQVSMKTAKKVWGMCSVEGFSHDFEMAFEKVNGN